MADARFRRSAGGVASRGVHVVWWPKYRRRVLGGRVAVRLSELFDEVAGENGGEIAAREVMPDHVHVVVRVRATDSPAEVAGKLKGRSSRRLREESPWLARRGVLWSKSYFVASVGSVSEQTVRRYIEHQWDQVA